MGGNRVMVGLNQGAGGGGDIGGTDNGAWI